MHEGTTRGGSRKEDILIAQARVRAAEAGRDEAKETLARSLVVSPTSGDILRIKARIGEYPRSTCKSSNRIRPVRAAMALTVTTRGDGAALDGLLAIRVSRWALAWPARAELGRAGQAPDRRRVRPRFGPP